MLNVAGIVRPRRTSPRATTIDYEKDCGKRAICLWRARRSMEVQQPGWGQQVYDLRHAVLSPGTVVPEEMRVQMSKAVTTIADRETSTNPGMAGRGGRVRPATIPGEP